MSSFRVNLEDDPSPVKREAEPMFAASREPKRRSKRPFIIAGGIVLGIALVLLVGGFVYWQSLKSSPQYSLALLVDAAKRDDKPAMDQQIDIDAVVDDFLPQITAKAVEMYGKGVPPAIIEKLTRVAAPILPAVKDRARAELPRVVRDRTEKFGNVPFFAMVIGASYYLDIKVDGDTAVVTSKIENRPFDVKMKKNGNRWQIVGLKDDKLATEIAKKVGQEMIAVAMGGVTKTGKTLGVGNLADLLKQAEDLVK